MQHDNWNPRMVLLAAGLAAVAVVAWTQASEPAGPSRPGAARPAAPRRSLAAAAPAVSRYDIAAVTLPAQPPERRATAGGSLAASAGLVQGRVLRGGDGLVTLAVQLAVAEGETAFAAPAAAADIVVVLDTSGSMTGAKIATARAAVGDLILRLRPEDRFALVTFESHASTPIPLAPAVAERTGRWHELVAGLQPGGGTNIEAGLGRGIDELRTTAGAGRIGRLLLLSDGQATAGTRDAIGLGALAGRAIALECSISTLGIGDGFDETVMTAIAEAGSGRGYYLPDSAALAEIFATELAGARRTTCSATAIHVATSPAVTLVEAGGYPLVRRGGETVFHPGDLRSGQERTLYLSFRVPVAQPGPVELGYLRISFMESGERLDVAVPGSFVCTCTEDIASVIGSFDIAAWTDYVRREGIGKLQEQCAALVADGRNAEAQQQVAQWLADVRGLSAHLPGAAVEAEVARAEQLAHSIAIARTAAERGAFSKEQLYDGKGKRQQGAWFSWE